MILVFKERKYGKDMNQIKKKEIGMSGELK